MAQQSICSEAHSYATRENAEKHLRKVLGTDIETLRWFVVAQPNGRFSPAVCLSSDQGHMIGFMLHKNICVIG